MPHRVLHEKSTMTRFIAAFIASAIGASAACGGDWPHWLGPNGNGSSPETGLLTQWPAAGPKLLWQVAGGDGYSSLAIAGGKAYTLVQRGADELAIALDAASG